MSRTLFNVPPFHFWPPLPGTNAPADEPPLLATLVDDLLDAAGTTAIRAPSDAPDPPSVTENFHEVRRAAKHFDIAPGLCLTDYLWTHSDAFYRGHIAATLRKAAPRIDDPHGFLLMLASDVAGPMLLTPSQRPVRVPSGVRTIAGVDGPFLALVAYALAPSGSAEAVGAVAVPIYHSRRFMPVCSMLDRYVLRLIEHLQVILDAHGVACMVRRTRSAWAGATCLTLDIGQPEPAAIQLFLTVGSPDHRPDVRPEDPSHFIITEQNWRSGHLVAWLEESLGFSTHPHRHSGA